MTALGRNIYSNQIIVIFKVITVKNTLSKILCIHLRIKVQKNNKEFLCFLGCIIKISTVHLTANQVLHTAHVLVLHT